MRHEILFGFLVVLMASRGFAAPVELQQAYPPHANVVDVTQPPYNAKGDGVTDDTAALQRALNENVGWHRVLFFQKAFTS